MNLPLVPDMEQNSLRDYLASRNPTGSSDKPISVNVQNKVKLFDEDISQIKGNNNNNQIKKLATSFTKMFDNMPNTKAQPTTINKEETPIVIVKNINKGKETSNVQNSNATDNVGSLLEKEPSGIKSDPKYVDVVSPFIFDKQSANTFIKSFMTSFDKLLTEHGRKGTFSDDDGILDDVMGGIGKRGRRGARTPKAPGARTPNVAAKPNVDTDLPKTAGKSGKFSRVDTSQIKNLAKGVAIPTLAIAGISMFGEEILDLGKNVGIVSEGVAESGKNIIKTGNEHEKKFSENFGSILSKAGDTLSASSENNVINKIGEKAGVSNLSYMIPGAFVVDKIKEHLDVDIPKVFGEMVGSSTGFLFGSVKGILEETLPEDIFKNIDSTLKNIGGGINKLVENPVETVKETKENIKKTINDNISKASDFLNEKVDTSLSKIEENSKAVMGDKSILSMIMPGTPVNPVENRKEKDNVITKNTTSVNLNKLKESGNKQYEAMVAEIMAVRDGKKTAAEAKSAVENNLNNTNNNVVNINNNKYISGGGSAGGSNPQIVILDFQQPSANPTGTVFSK